MVRARRLLAFGLAVLTLWPAAGCALLHELQPHRLQRWNRNPNYYRGDALFSVSDEPAERPRPPQRDQASEDP